MSESCENKYNQYRSFNNLPKLLKRFSFSEKMRITTRYSRLLMNSDGTVNNGQKHKLPMPWCLETFVMLSVDANEYKSGNFQGKNESKFIDMINAIWNASPLFLEKPHLEDYKGYIVTLIGETQFYFQEWFWIHLYRCYQMFSFENENLSIKTQFLQKFNSEYEDFVTFGLSLNKVYSIKKNNTLPIIPSDFLDCIISRFKNVFNNLVISRERYSQMQHLLTSENSRSLDYIFSVRPSYQYPFIQEGHSIFFPLPHLMMQNITTSMVYRLTENDDSLRASIGKEFLENYLFNLISKSNVYQEVYSEVEYSNPKRCHSPDVIANHGSEVLFLDSKSTVPNSKIRILEEDGFRSNISQISGYIVQLYKQIKLFSKYNPFSCKVSEDISNHWGVIVVLEDAYIKRQHYYEEAAKKLNIMKGSNDWDWLVKHIHVASLYSIEHACIFGSNIIDLCKQNVSGDSTICFNFASNTRLGDIKDSDFKNFINSSISKVNSTLQEVSISTLALE